MYFKAGWQRNLQADSIHSPEWSILLFVVDSDILTWFAIPRKQQSCPPSSCSESPC